MAAAACAANAGGEAIVPAAAPALRVTEDCAIGGYTRGRLLSRAKTDHVTHSYHSGNPTS